MMLVSAASSLGGYRCLSDACVEAANLWDGVGTFAKGTFATGTPGPSGRAGSMQGQDEWVLQTLNYKRGGSFLSIGEHDGESYSNTVVLERVYGWRGICVEANPHSMAQLRAHRTCAAFNYTLGGALPEEVDFCDAQEMGGVLGLPDRPHMLQKDTVTGQWAALPGKCPPGAARRVTTTPVQALLQEARAPSVMDYLSIDVEGAELTILRAFPFEHHRFRCITVEHNEPLMGPRYRAQLRELLEGQGYRWAKGSDSAFGPSVEDFYVWPGEV